MTTFKQTLRCMAIVLPLIAVAVMIQYSATATEPAPEDPKPEAVADSMHHLMEYYFEPQFHKLKEAMAKEPADGAGWKPIKSATLILGEGGNLLIHCAPEEGKADWLHEGEEIRKHGKMAYDAARKKDFATARKQYESMVRHCNSCHRKFADGKYQLTP